MSVRKGAAVVVLAAGLGVATVYGAAVSRQQADAFARKIETIENPISWLEPSPACAAKGFRPAGPRVRA